MTGPGPGPGPGMGGDCCWDSRSKPGVAGPGAGRAGALKLAVEEGGRDSAEEEEAG